MPTNTNNGTTISTAGSNYGYSTSYGATSYGTIGNSTQSDSADLPEMVIATRDENGNDVRMVLKPESNISSSDCMKLTMLMTAMTVAPAQFNALAYVKKQNLERHFKYS